MNLIPTAYDVNANYSFILSSQTIGPHGSSNWEIQFTGEELKNLLDCFESMGAMGEKSLGGETLEPREEKSTEAANGANEGEAAGAEPEGTGEGTSAEPGPEGSGTV